LYVARTFLRYLRIIEQTLCFIAFMIMAGALIYDVLKREITGSGAFGAPQVGVIGMIIVAYVGIALASANGSHFRPRFADGLLIKYDKIANRIGEFGFSIFCFFMAYVATNVTIESHELADVSAVLRWPIWPVQSVMVLGFGLVAIRHFLYGTFYELRPALPKQAEDLSQNGDEASAAKHAQDEEGAGP